MLLLVALIACQSLAERLGVAPPAQADDPPVVADAPPPSTAPPDGEGRRGRGPPPGSPAAALTVVNPTTKAALAVYVETPRQSDAPAPLLVVVPGGISGGAKVAHGAMPYVQSGFVLATFDADGRGASTGTEDYGGTQQQDGLAEIVRTLAKDPRVDPTRIGLVSLSYGVTMAVGALTRHPDLPVRFLLDWEGPADRASTAGCVDGKPTDRGDNPVRWGACDDDAWWTDREAVRRVGSLKIPYARLQFLQDHVQTNYAHTRAMLAAALAGGVPSVRLNGVVLTSAPKTDAAISPITGDAPANEVIAEQARLMTKEVTGLEMAAPPPMERRRPPGGGRPVGGAPVPNRRMPNERAR